MLLFKKFKSPLNGCCIREINNGRCIGIQNCLLCYLVICAALSFIIFLIATSCKTTTLRRKTVLFEDLLQDESSGMCTIGKLEKDNPEIVKYYFNNGGDKCVSQEDDWVNCKGGKCFIEGTSMRLLGDIRCVFKEIIREVDGNIRYGPSVMSMNSYMLKLSDIVDVRCGSANNITWRGTLMGARKLKPKPIVEEKKANIEVLPFLNVLILGLSSLSKNAFMRELPLSYRYMTEDLAAYVLQNYNVVGDTSFQILISLLTGETDLKLASLNRKNGTINYVDYYPFIWKEYEKKGYVTACNTDQALHNIFGSSIHRFRKQPTDHYINTYFTHSKLWNYSTENSCFRGKTRQQVMLKYTKDLMLSNKDKLKFTFNFHRAVGFNRFSRNLIEVSDLELSSWLLELSYEGILENTIFIVMSDHGSQMKGIMDTLQGRQEERLPFVSIVIPKSFEQRFPLQFDNFLGNIEKLTTQYDIYETLVDILKIQEPKLLSLSVNEEKLMSQGISLFKKIPSIRSCKDASIPSQWCACLEWHKVPVSSNYSELLIGLATSLRDTLNKITEPQRAKCEVQKDGLVQWLKELVPSKGLLKGRGKVVGDLKLDFHMYQVQILFGKYNMLYETLIRYWPAKQKFHVDVDDITLVNKQKHDPSCIYSLDLWKFCYCRQADKIEKTD